MGDGWVAFAYVVTYGTIATYITYLVLRTRTLRRRAENR